MTTPTNQPTDQPTTYVSIRLNVGERQFDRVVADVLHDSDYVAYPHRGKKGDNPHFHILVLTDKPEKYRKRIKDNLGLIGNKFVSIKLQHNGLLAGIQYCAREHTEPIVSSPSMLTFVEQAPKWVQSSIKSSDSGKCKDKDWQLTYVNLVSVALQHAKEHSLTDYSLKQTVEHLMSKTKWRPSKWMLTGGVVEFYENDFLFRLGKRPKMDMSWWTPRI